MTALASEIGVSRKHLSNVLHGHAPLADAADASALPRRAASIPRRDLPLDRGAAPGATDAVGFMRAGSWRIATSPSRWRAGRCSRTDAACVLDTCALVALAEREPMRRAAVEAIRAAQARGGSSCRASLRWSSRQKAAARRVQARCEAIGARLVRGARCAVALRRVPVTADMALAAYELPEPFHKDPADRLIVAVARLLKAPVVTIDRRILAYGRQGHVQVLAY